MAFDCSYLKETVGEALARGCADTVVAEPNDPIEFLGKWLLRYVKNAEVEGKFYMERDLQTEAEKKKQDDAQAAKAAAEALRAEKHKVLEELAAAEEDPFVLFKQAVELVEKYTDASASYVATIEKGDEPPGELGEEEAESEDEEAPPVPPEEREEEPAAEEPPAAAEDGVEPNIVKFDYAGAFLRYVAATANDEDTIKKIGTLTRPAPPAEDEPEPEEGDEKPKVIPLPPTFSMLDEQVPTMFIPNVADNPSISFFRRFPRMGSYFAAAVQSAEDEYKALICADTIVPAGSGKAFSQDDRDFIWDVSRSLTKALQGRESARVGTYAEASFEQVFKDIEEQVTKTLYPQPETPVDGEPEPESAPEGAEEVEEEPPAEEEDDIARCQREIRNIEKYIAVAEKAVTTAMAVTEVRKVVLRLWATQVETVTADAVAELAQMTHAPQATFHVLKAVLYILKEDMAQWSSWPAARPLITPDFFQKVLAIDATAERDTEAWTNARKELKACDESKLPAECPKSNIGRLLRKYIRATRATANKAVTQREKEAEKAAKEAEKAAKEEELAGFEKAKADEEAAAAAAAEAEAAAAAAEAEGEGEEGATAE